MLKQILQAAIWFVPLLVGFTAVAVLVNDLRHPAATERSCSIIALGPNVPRQLKGTSVMYHTGRGPQHNIGLSCKVSDLQKSRDASPVLLWVNDETPFAYGQIALGDTVTLREIRYRFLPVQHRLTVNNLTTQ